MAITLREKLVKKHNSIKRIYNSKGLTQVITDLQF